jgi:hypothetical protein
MPFQTQRTLAPFETVSGLGEKKSSFTDTTLVAAPLDGIAPTPTATATAARTPSARLI